MRIALEVEYDGTAYCGWQRQKNGVSVQETLENALEKALGAPVKVTGSGRTDAGVHAFSQVAHLDAETAVPADKISVATNAFLPADVRIKRSAEAPEGFHARYGAKKKTYVYTWYVSDFVHPLFERYAVRTANLDEDRMRKALGAVIGERDFAALSSAGSSVKDTVRTVYRAELKRLGDFLKLEIAGNGFLYNMVRIIAGTLADIGSGRLGLDALDRALAENRRELAGKTAPAKGLCLAKVEYGCDVFGESNNKTKDFV